MFVMLGFKMSAALLREVMWFCVWKNTNQLCHVKWGGEKSANFPISNGVKQGGVISPLLFSLYVDELFLLLKKSGLIYSTLSNSQSTNNSILVAGFICSHKKQ